MKENPERGRTVIAPWGLTLDQVKITLTCTIRIGLPA